MKPKPRLVKLEDIQHEVGNILYHRWQDEGSHEFDRVSPEALTKIEYRDMYVQWRYHNFKETEQLMRKNPGTCWDGGE